MIMEKYGEKYSGDSRFVAECRELQSIYRARIGQAIRPYKGRDGKVHYYGNYISDGENSGANFLTRHAFEYAKKRVAEKKEYETIEADRLFNNLLSSQPMAFNLFCPLMEMLEKSPKEATMVIKAALPYYPIHIVTKVDLEFIPKDYDTLSGDKSAMDAIIEYIDLAGKKGFIAIETKYSENLGTNIALERGTNMPRTQSLEAIRKLKCFKADVETRILEGKTRLTQIYRNFLLSETYGDRYDMRSDSIILAPALHPTTSKEVASLKKELRDEYQDKIKDITLEDFVESILSVCPDEYKSIFIEFRNRYLSFESLEQTSL